MPIRFLTETALLGALITITGAIKLPGLLPGTEFQLSAPLAVAICAAFGFKKYIIAGILSSAVGLLLGTQTLFNVYVAMIFRLVVGGVLSCGGTSGLWCFSPVLLAQQPLVFLWRFSWGRPPGRFWPPLCLAWFIPPSPLGR